MKLATKQTKINDNFTLVEKLVVLYYSLIRITFPHAVKTRYKFPSRLRRAGGDSCPGYFADAGLNF